MRWTELNLGGGDDFVSLFPPLFDCGSYLNRKEIIPFSAPEYMQVDSTGLISFEISKNKYGNLKVKSAAVSKLMTFALYTMLTSLFGWPEKWPKSYTGSKNLVIKPVDNFILFCLLGACRYRLPTAYTCNGYVRNCAK
jgi:hypothetical protein